MARVSVSRALLSGVVDTKVTHCVLNLMAKGQDWGVPTFRR